MEKKFIYIYFTATTLLIIYIFLAFFYQGKLNLKILNASGTLIVDNKEYPGIKDKTLTLSAKKHNVVIKSNNYKDYSEVIKVPLWRTKTLEITLTPVEEVARLTEISKQTTETWINFTNNKNKDEFLKKIKNFVQTDVYDSLELMITQAQTPTRPDIRTILPIVSSPINDTLLDSFTENSAMITVNVTKTENEDSIKNLVYLFTKENNKWLISDIQYNY